MCLPCWGLDMRLLAIAPRDQWCGYNPTQRCSAYGGFSQEPGETLQRCGCDSPGGGTEGSSARYNTPVYEPNSVTLTYGAGV